MIDMTGLALPKPDSGPKLTPYQRGKQRKRLWNERDHVCAICHLPIVSIYDMELDHEIPGKAGGCKDDSDSNQRLTHIICNRKKGSRRNV